MFFSPESLMCRQKLSLITNCYLKTEPFVCLELVGFSYKSNTVINVPCESSGSPLTDSKIIFKPSGEIEGAPS